MRKIICELKLKDGSEIKLSLEAESAQGEYPVNYSGVVEKLSRKIETGDVDDVKAFSKNMAQELNAELSVQEEGDYDRWAE